jgi:putative glutathione S-transferase
VYKCGFAQSQEAYDGACAALFAGLERLEAILATQRYLVSNSAVTEADVRAFATLVRFDEVYVVYFKCNQKNVRDFPNLRHFCREMFQLPGIAGTVNMRQIKEHYYTSHAHLNPVAVIPTGPGVTADFALPHDRASK